MPAALPPETALELTVNGQRHSLAVSSVTTLLHVLRNDLGLNGPKLGCGLGQCGACTVWVDGVAARSCIMPACELSGRAITTLEGLGTLDQPHLVQQAFIDAQAAQCGYCLNGMIMMAALLLRDNDDPSDHDIRCALSANLCRCGTHLEIMQAVRLASQRLRAQRKAQP